MQSVRLVDDVAVVREPTWTLPTCLAGSHRASTSSTREHRLEVGSLL